jgi:proteasome lid subunit RPN8/RPN11
METQKPLFRSRPSNNRDFVVLGQEADGFEVFIHKRAIAKLAYFLRETAPNEAFGLLAGRPGIDGRGEYAVITGAIRARDGEVKATPGRVHVNTVNQQALRRQLEIKEPIAEPVGWWHTHPHGPGAYSSEDFREQATWPESYHVGVLISGRSERPMLTVYRGPTASLVGGHALPNNNPPIHYHVTKPRRTPQEDKKVYMRLHPGVVTALILGWFLPLVVGVVAFTLINQHVHSSDVPIINPIADPVIPVACSPRSGPSPLTVACEALTLSSFVDLQWRLEEGVILSGSSTSHVYQSPGEYDISLIGTGPEGQPITFRILRIRVEDMDSQTSDENQAPPD